MNKDLPQKTLKKNVKNQPMPFRLENPGKEINEEKIFTTLKENLEEYKKMFDNSNEPKYLYWDKFKFKFPSDSELSTEDKWYLVRQLRNLSSIEIPVKSGNEKHFKWLKLPSSDELLHKIDMFAGGRLFNKNLNISPTNKNTFLNRGIIEEAIASSQLEGAHTTRKAARDFLVSKRSPKNESEQMILNNYKTINAIADSFKNQKLSRSLLFEMHSMLTENTVNKTEQHRFRKDNDEIIVQGQIGSEEYTTHVPPNEDFVEKNIDDLIKYANDLDEKFSHPITKAIFLHFWIGYLHPFTDGNGRLARAIFYWYLLRKDYWTFMYLPISTILKKSPLQYAMAYIYTEQDNLDITYFYDFNIQKIIQAIGEFEQYLDTKLDENRIIDSSLDKSFDLNDRQKQLIHYLVSDRDPSLSITSYSILHSVTRQTAEKDLKYLEKNKLIYSKKSGKYVKYYPTEKLMAEFSK